MNKIIPSKQLRFSVATFIIASGLLTKTLYTFTKNQAWMSVVLAIIIGYVVITIYGKLALRYPGLTLVEIDEAVFGLVAGKIVSTLYIFFFLTLAVFNTQDLGVFVHSIMLPSTPINVIYIIFIGVCASAVKKGAENISRYAAVITFGYIAAIVINDMLLLNKTRLENLLPVFTVPLKNYLIGAHLVVMLPFCEILAFLMIPAYLKNAHAVAKALKSGLLMAAVILLFVILRDIAVLGNYVMITSLPTFNVIRLINVGDILTRLEIIYAVFLMILMFFKVTILLSAVVSGVGQLLNIERDNIFIFMFGALVVVCANFFFKSSFEHTKWFDVAATYATFFLLLLPVLTLIISVSKKTVPIINETPGSARKS